MLSPQIDVTWIETTMTGAFKEETHTDLQPKGEAQLRNGPRGPSGRMDVLNIRLIYQLNLLVQDFRKEDVTFPEPAKRYENMIEDQLYWMLMKKEEEYVYVNPRITQKTGIDAKWLHHLVTTYNQWLETENKPLKTPDRAKLMNMEKQLNVAVNKHLSDDDWNVVNALADFTGDTIDKNEELLVTEKKKRCRALSKRKCEKQRDCHYNKKKMRCSPNK